MIEIPKQKAILANCSLFAGLDDKVLLDISKLTRKIRLKTDQVLFRHGDKSDGCYAIIDGAVKVTQESSDGGETLLAVLGEGDVAGEMGLVDGELRSASIKALKQSELAFLPTISFNRYAEENPAIYQHMLKIICARLRSSNEVNTAHQLLPISGRLARVLLRLADGFGQDVDSGRILIRQKFTQADLGRMSGSARENVSRQINDWRRNKIISRISGYYCIEDWDELRKLARL